MDNNNEFMKGYCAALADVQRKFNNDKLTLVLMSEMSIVMSNIKLYNLPEYDFDVLNQLLIRNRKKRRW